MNIKTKSVYDPIEEDDGIRIAVMRKPVWIGKERYKIDLYMTKLGPSKELLDDWNNENVRISWQEYEERYLKEMESQQEALQKVRELASKETVTLLCHERGAPEDEIKCHRRLLKELLLQTPQLNERSAREKNQSKDVGIADTRKRRVMKAKRKTQLELPF